MVASEDHAFRFLVKSLLQNLPDISDQVLPFPAFPATDVGLLPASAQQNLLRAVFVNHLVSRSLWHKLYAAYRFEIASDERHYVQAVLHCCLYMHRSPEEVFDRFLDVLSLVTSNAFLFPQFRDRTAALLVVLFEDVMRPEFYEAGGWAGLQRYLQGLPYLDWYHLRGLPAASVARRRLQKEVEWQASTRSYGPGIRFLSYVDALMDPQCKSLADRIFAFDPSLEELLDLEELLVPLENVPRSRYLVLSRKGQGGIEGTSGVVPHEGKEIVRDTERLLEQKSYELGLLDSIQRKIKGVEKSYCEASEAVASLLPFYVES